MSSGFRSEVAEQPIPVRRKHGVERVVVKAVGDQGQSFAAAAMISGARLRNNAVRSLSHHTVASPTTPSSSAASSAADACPPAGRTPVSKPGARGGQSPSCWAYIQNKNAYIPPEPVARCEGGARPRRGGAGAGDGRHPARAPGGGEGGGAEEGQSRRARRCPELLWERKPKSGGRKAVI